MRTSFNFGAKKYLAAGIVAVIALIFIVPVIGVAHAVDTTAPSSYSCNILRGNLATCFSDWVLSFFSWIFQLLIIVGAWLIEKALELNTQIYGSAVQSGYGVLLSIANLVFVLAIIIIALATILRRESYGYKKTLWRLIVMAILINFGLVLTAPIVGFANDMTTYFLNNIQGGVAGVQSFTNQLGQTLSIAAGDAPPTSGIASAAGSVVSGLMTLIFVIMFKGLIALAFFLIGLVLFVRYIYLSVLLIILPLAWVTWIFPGYSKHFSSWWNKFIHWSFFAPAAMFFIWLALSIQQNAACQNGNNPCTALAQTVGSGLLNQFTSNLVVMGVMIGGLMASSKLAGGAGSWAVAQGKAVSGYVGRRAGQTARRAATRPLRTQTAKNLATKLQQQPTSALGKWGNRLTLGIGGWTARKAGQRLEATTIAGGSGAVAEAAGRYKNLTSDQRLNRLTDVELGNQAAQRMALLKQILEDKNISKLSLEEMDRYFGKGTEDQFKRYGQEKLYKELREKSGLALRDIDKEIQEIEKQPKPLTKDDAEKLADKQAEKKKLVSTYIEENTDGAVENFTDPEKLKKKREAAAKTGRIAASLMPESIELIQRSIAEGIAGGLSTQNVSTLMKALAKKNNIDGFKDAVDKMKSSTDPAIVTLVAKMKSDYASNEPIKKWNTRNVARGDLDVDLDKVYS